MSIKKIKNFVTKYDAYLVIFITLICCFIISLPLATIPQPTEYKVTLQNENIELFEKNIYYEIDDNKVLTIYRSGNYKTIYQADTWVKIEPIFQIEKY